jgi:hypothetical protein
LVEEVAAVNPNTIVVLNTGQPVALPWIDKVKAILEMWWPGDEGGWATANLLLGKMSPGGRLPVTWARRLEDYAATSPDHTERSQKGVNHKTTFSEGVDVGYRWFDRQKIEPLFSFGYGLSYTAFAYSDLRVERLLMAAWTYRSLCGTWGIQTATRCHRCIWAPPPTRIPACNSRFVAWPLSTAYSFRRARAGR